MDRSKRFPTPSHNPNAKNSDAKNSASKQLHTTISRGHSMNKTVCASFGSSDRSEHPRIKFALSSAETTTQILETECDLVYNDYLQALMKQEIIENEIMQQRNILEGQLKLQSENLKKQKDAYEETINEIDLLEKRTELVGLVNSLDMNIERLKTVYSVFQTESNITKLVSLLSSENDKVVLKNIKLINTQEEYNRLIAILDHLDTAMVKILKSGHNFNGIHHLANEIKHFLELSNKVQALQTVYSDLEKKSLFSLLQSLSDNFAKQYIDSEDCE